MRYKEKRVCVKGGEGKRTGYVTYCINTNNNNCNNFTHDLQLSLLHACRYSNYSSPSACILAQTTTPRIPHRVESSGKIFGIAVVTCGWRQVTVRTLAEAANAPRVRANSRARVSPCQSNAGHYVVNHR